jgi:exonuclease I
MSYRSDMTFYFYDLETTGRSPREHRIMQFAGQRTDGDLNPIGEPDNIFIKLTPDILPEPDAILVTGITPQQAITEGITEAEFLKYFIKEICTDDTVLIISASTMSLCALPFGAIFMTRTNGSGNGAVAAGTFWTWRA